MIAYGNLIPNGRMLLSSSRRRNDFEAIDRSRTADRRSFEQRLLGQGT